MLELEKETPVLLCELENFFSTWVIRLKVHNKAKVEGSIVEAHRTRDYKLFLRIF
jgi:hypothetical protein